MDKYVHASQSMAYYVALRQDNLEVKCPTNQRLDEALRSMFYLRMNTI